MRDRTPELVVLVLLVVLIAGGALLGGGDGSGSPAAAEGGRVTGERVALISRRVEELRDLRFERPVRVEVVPPAEARRVGLAEMAQAQPVAERRADEELLQLLGLLPAGTDMQEVTASIFAEQVAGFYDPRRERLALVEGAGVDDVTLAHELAHALEDQHFDLERLGDGPGDDRALAEQALAEGTATRLMEDYAARWPSDTPVGDALAGLTQITTSTPLPAYVMRSLIFPYIQGETFVSSLRETAGGDWRLVDVALRSRPPVTTAEILDPDRWLRAQRPKAVALGGAAALRRLGWRRLDGSTLGAETVAALLTDATDPLRARRLTDGWRGAATPSGAAARCRRPAATRRVARATPCNSRCGRRRRRRRAGSRPR